MPADGADFVCFFLFYMFLSAVISPISGVKYVAGKYRIFALIIFVTGHLLFYKLILKYHLY